MKKIGFFRCPVCGGRHGLTSRQLYQNKFEEGPYCCAACGAKLYWQMNLFPLLSVTIVAVEVLLLYWMRQTNTEGFLIAVRVIWAMQLFPNVELEYMSRRIWYTPVFWGGILIYLLHPVCVNPPAPWKKKEWIQDPDLLVYLIFIIASMLFLSYNELNLLQEGFRMLKNAG